jgi:hypothetical protein
VIEYWKPITIFIPPERLGIGDLAGKIRIVSLSRASRRVTLVRFDLTRTTVEPFRVENDLRYNGGSCPDSVSISRSSGLPCVSVAPSRVYSILRAGE